MHNFVKLKSSELKWSFALEWKRNGDFDHLMKKLLHKSYVNESFDKKLSFSFFIVRKTILRELVITSAKI